MSDTVPVIDLASAAPLRAVDEACRDWGFFQIIGHGIDSDLFEALRRQMHAFFSQPCATKRAVARSERNPWGYFDRELTKNTRDWKQLFDYAETRCGASVPQWPAGLTGFKSTLIDYFHACETVALRLVRMISENLGMAPHALDHHFARGHSSWGRLNYYPVCANPERPADVATPRQGHLGVNHHTDAGAVTLLLQDEQPGLEVYRQGRWSLVEPMADALVINIGDIVQVWSNDRYRAPLHRVIANANAERFSAPFFFCPSYETDYAPLAATVDADNPAHYRAINWGHFYSMRTSGDYADHGEEIQISQYRT
jgi:isopenicillin N synthase-like dioxygenase